MIVIAIALAPEQHERRSEPAALLDQQSDPRLHLEEAWAPH
jgi:hypothetical protein